MELADTGVFSADLLRAIDRALSLGEARRPQTIAAFRQALEKAGPPPAREPASRTTLLLRQQVDESLAPFGSGPDSLRKNVLGTEMSLHLVGYSKHRPRSRLR
jgi:hypothetical protein